MSPGVRFFALSASLLSASLVWAEEKPVPQATGAASEEAPKTEALKTEAPKVREPSFPLEPNKKPTQVIDPKSYVQGADEPPPADPESVAAIPRANRSLKTWWSAFELGWFYANQSAIHYFNGTSGRTFQTRRNNSNPLSLFLRFETRPPRFPLSMVLSLSGTTGTADATTSGNTLIPSSFTAQEGRGSVGFRFHPLRRKSRSDLRLGLDAGGAIASVTTLTAAQDNIDVDHRKIFLLTPRLEYRYSPHQNWFAALGLGYSRALSATGTGNVVGKPYRRIDGELQAVRYVAPGSAIGLGAFYSNERVTWTQTIPSVLTDEVITQDLRLSLFWRKDF